MWRKQRAVYAVAVVVALALPVQAGVNPFGLNENHPYGIISNAYETPHVTWARPYAGGPIKALVLAPVFTQRETVELAQRLSLDYTAWMSETFTEMTAAPAADQAFAFFQPPPAVVHRHLRECVAGSYDVILIGKLDWAMLPGEQRLQVLEKVSAGTGLVYVGPPAGNRELEIVFGGAPAPEGCAFVAAAVPLEALPAFQGRPAADVVRASAFGKGRVVVLDYGKLAYEMESGCLTPRWAEPASSRDSGHGYSDEYYRPTGFVPPDECLELEFVPYEYYQALVARAVMWASGKTPAVRLARLALPAVLEYPATAYSAQVTTVGAEAGTVLRAAVRQRFDYDQVVTLPEQPAGAESGVKLPPLPAGEYFLDVWLVSAGGETHDWASTRFTVHADLAIGTIALTDKSYDPGDTANGHVALSRPLGPGEALTVELWDNYRRRIAQQSPPGAGPEYAFSFVLARPLTILHSIRARVSRESHDVCARRLQFPVRIHAQRPAGFQEIVWAGVGNSFLANQVLRKLSRCDQVDAIDVGFGGATHARNLAAANLAALPYTAGFGHFGTQVVPTLSGDRARGGCMTNPVTQQAVDEWFAAQGEKWGPYGPAAWSHGDESYYASNPDACWSETCLAALREFLRTRYADLAALNREWGTAYGDWAAVLPLTYDEARATGRYAPWIEQRLAQQLVFARLYQRTGAALQATDPGALVGFDGPQSLDRPNGGINWWVLKDYVGILQDYQYNSQSMEIFRSFAKPQHLSGMWYGTYGLTWQVGPNTVPAHHNFPWYSVFHGLNSTWMWTMGAPGSIGGYAPDLTDLPFFAASRESLQTIRTGVFELLHTGQRANDGIAIHYSEVSRLADSLFADSKTSSAWSDSLADVNHAIEDCGLQYAYVAYEEIEQGELRKGNYRVLFMPHSRAVSEREAVAIRQFVEEGGLLIADILPGVLNGHGTRQEPGMLADLFPKADPGMVNAVGKGKTVLLGDALRGYGGASYNHQEGWQKLEGRWHVLARLLDEQAGITAPVRIRHLGEGEMPPTEVTRFVAGDSEFVGLLRRLYYYDNAPYPASVQFPRQSHIYDVRAGTYLGFTDRLTADISYEARLYALLPYRVNGLQVSGPGRAAAGERSQFDLAVKGGWRTRPGAHVVRVEVLDPAGKTLPWYAANVTAANGRGAYAIDWALNDPPGRYTVVVRDVASGVTTRHEVSLR
jgi:hypothetical protein